MWVALPRAITGCPPLMQTLRPREMKDGTVATPLGVTSGVHRLRVRFRIVDGTTESLTTSNWFWIQ